MNRKCASMSQIDESNQVPDPRRFGIGGDEPLFAGGIPAGEVGRAAVIRAAADGELDGAEQTEAVAAALADSGAEVSFERRLREATGRVMGGVSAPAGLRERIAALAQQASVEQAATDALDQEALAAGLAERSTETRSPGFWSSGVFSRGRVVGAIAAVLLLGVAGVFVSQMSSLTTQQGDTLAYRTSLAQFVSGEHTRTLDDRVAETKYTYKAADDASVAMTKVLASTPVIPPCDGRTKFRGASPCGVPGKGPSAHMQFVLPAENDSAGRIVSVFVKQDRGELPIEENTTYRINAKACHLSDVYICVWRHEGLLYTLVSEDNNAPMCAVFMSQFGVAPPDPAHSL